MPVERDRSRSQACRLSACDAPVLARRRGDRRAVYDDGPSVSGCSAIHASPQRAHVRHRTQRRAAGSGMATTPSGCRGSADVIWRRLQALLPTRPPARCARRRSRQRPHLRQPRLEPCHRRAGPRPDPRAFRTGRRSTAGPAGTRSISPTAAALVTACADARRSTTALSACGAEQLVQPMRVRRYILNRPGSCSLKPHSSDSPAGRAAETDGWFVVNVAEAAGVHTDRFGARRAASRSRRRGSREFGINVRVLQPGQPNCRLPPGERPRRPFSC